MFGDIIVDDDYKQLSEKVLKKMGMEEPDKKTTERLTKAIQEAESEVAAEQEQRNMSGQRHLEYHRNYPGS